MLRVGERLPALDGLRGVAALGVLGFHIGEQLDEHFHDGQIHWLPVGGHLGVPVFYALSGYLITSLLLRERDLTGRVDLRHFYLRRAARLGPLLAVVVAITLAFQLTSGGGADAWLQAGLAITYVQNVALAVAPWGEVHGYVGTWSLAQEEQFYILWPTLLLYLVARGRSRRMIAWALISAAVVMWMSRSGTMLAGDQVSAMFAPWNRADALALGAAAALAAPRVPRRTALIGVPVSLGFLLVLYWSAAIFAASTYTVAMTLAPVCAVAAIVAGREVPGVLGWRPLMHLGRISYGVYLWPTAVIVVGHSLAPGIHGPWFATVLALASVPVAHLSWRYFETPIIQAAARRRSGRVNPQVVPDARDPEGRGVVPIEVVNQ